MGSYPPPPGLLSTPVFVCASWPPQMAGTVIDYEHWQMPLGRRFRALKLWFVLRRFGASGIRNHLRTGIAHRRRLEAFIAQEPSLELAAPPSLSLVCFRLKGKGNDAQMQLLDVRTGWWGMVACACVCV